MLIGLFVLAAACGGADEKTSVSREDYPNQLVELYCGVIAACCRAAGSSVDASACPSLVQPIVDRALADPALALRYDGVVAARCLDAAKRAYADCTLLNSELDALDHDCRQIWVGTRMPGESCTTAAECALAPGQLGTCGPVDGSAPMTCAVTPRPTRGKLGAECSGSCDDVGPLLRCQSASGLPGGTICYESDSLECDINASPPTCKPLPAAGEPCALSCQTGFYCDAASCRRQAEEGEACTTLTQCREGVCENSKCAPLQVSASTCAGIFG
ncbi:MAG: hypothetical protein QM756_09380 [Polyangiaceae bacterium]